MTKSKAPAFQFYYKDYLGDGPLAFTPSSVRGIWTTLLCMMWDVDKPHGSLKLERGKISGFYNDFPRALRCEKEEWSLFLLYAEAYGFCDLDVTGDKNVINSDTIVTITNRRMFREEKAKKNHALTQQRYRMRQKSDKEVIPLSASAPAKKEIIKKEKFLDCVFLTQDQHQSLKDKYGDLLQAIFQKLNNYKMASGRKYKSDYHAILSWVGNEVEKEHPQPKTNLTVCRDCKKSANRLLNGLCDECLKKYEGLPV